MPIRVFAMPGTEPWIPSGRDLATLNDLTSSSVTVEFWPRSKAAEAWEKWHPGRTYNRRPFANRAWSNKDSGITVMLVDESETPRSVLFGLVHELAHLDLRRSQLLRRAFKSHKGSDYLSSDAGHDQYPEEQLADFVADQTLKRMGVHDARKYNRSWWRRRLNRN